MTSKRTLLNGLGVQVVHVIVANVGLAYYHRDLIGERKYQLYFSPIHTQHATRLMSPLVLLDHGDVP